MAEAVESEWVGAIEGDINASNGGFAKQYPTAVNCPVYCSGFESPIAVGTYGAARVCEGGLCPEWETDTSYTGKSFCEENLKGTVVLPPTPSRLSDAPGQGSLVYLSGIYNTSSFGWKPPNADGNR